MVSPVLNKPEDRGIESSARNHSLTLGRIIPFGACVGGLTEFFVWTVLLLSFSRRLFPGLVMLKAFILFVLYLTGMIGSAIQLFGPVIKACQNNSERMSGGLSVESVIGLAQQGTCEDWYVVFSFWVTGMCAEVWIFVVARRVLAVSDGM